MAKKKSKTIPILIGVAALVIVIVGVYISMSNGLVKQKNEVDAAWGQVENVLQRRYDLIPNLVSSVQGSMDQETKVFGQISEARKAYASAGTTDEKVDASQQVESSLQTLINVIHESYPELASNQNVQNLMTQLEGTENRIATERKRYNEEVLAYNNKVSLFPTSIIAGMKGYDKMPQFKADEGAAEAPKVDFN